MTCIFLKTKIAYLNKFQKKKNDRKIFESFPAFPTRQIINNKKKILKLNKFPGKIAFSLVLLHCKLLINKHLIILS